MLTSMLIQCTKWLTGSWLNLAVAGHGWVIPTLQTIHILSVAVVFSGALLINLRIVGLVERDQPIGAVLDRFLWPVTLAVGVLATTGILLIVGEPNRALFRVVFWVKIALIVVSLLLIWSHRLAFGHGSPAAVSVSRKLLAITGLLFWVAVIVAGRWIAYADAWPGAPS